MAFHGDVAGKEYRQILAKFQDQMKDFKGSDPTAAAGGAGAAVGGAAAAASKSGSASRGSSSGSTPPSGSPPKPSRINFGARKG